MNYKVVKKNMEFRDGEPECISEIAENLDGVYIGDIKFAKQLEKLGIKPEPILDGEVCSIGFSSKDNKWYGWSHRAMYGFKIGDIVKKGDCCTSSGYTDEYLKEHPEEDTILPIGFEAKTLDDAKKMAIVFAESVS